MKRFILTGAPGSGKTSIVRALAAAGYPVVEEAATDVMAARLALAEAEPWADPQFIDRIAVLQRQRRAAPVSPGATVQVHDRSAACTLALARYLGHPVTPLLAEEAASCDFFDRRVFFVRPLGFVQPTAVRVWPRRSGMFFVVKRGRRPFGDLGGPPPGAVDARPGHAPGTPRRAQ